MADIEKTIEILQETDSPEEIQKFVEEHLEGLLDYLLLTLYSESQKTSKLAVLDFIKGVITEKQIAQRLCTEKYIFGLRSIRKHSHSKKVPDGVVSLCYEIYADGMKVLLETMPRRVLEIIQSHLTLCYLEQLLKSSDYNPIVEMFPCFFSLSEDNFSFWIKLLAGKDVILIIIKYFHKFQKTQKEIQNLCKFLYLFVSFTGNLFKDSVTLSKTGLHYTHFYKEIEKRTHTLLDTIFTETDGINRFSCLEVINEMIRTVEYLPESVNNLSFLYRYLIHSEILKKIEESEHTPIVTLRVIHLINIITRTIRYKSVEMLNFLKKTELLSHIAVYLYSTTTYGVTNEVCYLLNELIYVDKVFYIDLIIEFSQSVKIHTFKRVIKIYSVSQKKHNAHASITDCITPVIYILYKLYYICLHESTRKHRESRTQPRRFIVIDETTESYKILQELEFLQEEQAYWYITTRVMEHGRRMSMEYSRSLSERHPNAEQFARYFCEYTASILPAYPPWLFQ